MISEETIIANENRLRDWFTRGEDPVKKIIDGLDIGWGGAQRWAAGQMPITRGVHLDIACGYGTFLAQIGWHYPELILIGLNIDFSGPHQMIHDLLKQAQVQAMLIQADAQDLPFKDACFSSISCFLGLQDIKIGFGIPGLQKTLEQATRTLKSGGILTLIDEFDFSEYDSFLDLLQFEVIVQGEYTLDIQWHRPIAEQAIRLYAKGWVEQQRIKVQSKKESEFIRIHRKMREDMERQFQSRGYFIPFGPIRMLILKKR